MLRTASAARKLLPEARPRVVEFVRGQVAPDGGFLGRGASSDLYYTVFGIECLLALEAELPGEPLAAWLRARRRGDGLDLVHLACLVRSLAAVSPGDIEGEAGAALAGRIEASRASDGGYSERPGSATSSAYGTFVAAGALQDLGRGPPRPDLLAAALRALRSADGGFSNEPGLPVGVTSATAAAVVLLAEVGEPADPAVGDWLLARVDPRGGFAAAPALPVPDLLSTATALFALEVLGVPRDAIREPCLDFLDSLWSERGGFAGSWGDRTLDCEYTWYGLLALGSLA